MKKIYIFIFINLIYLGLKAQDQPVANQYLLNKFFNNPAFVGSSKEAIIVKLTDRHQWIGVTDAPYTQTISAQGRIGKTNGVGFCLYNDKNGANYTRGIQLAYAYMIRFPKIRFLLKPGDYTEPMISFGLSFNGYQLSLDEREFINYNNDPLYKGVIQKTFIPNANTGIYFYSPTLYAGLSANQILPLKVNIYNQEIEPKTKTYIFANLGVSLGESTTMYNWGFEPSLLFKMDTDKDRQLDINFKVRYARTFWLAASYRRNLDQGGGSNMNAVFLAGVDYHQYRFAYVYDHSLSELRTFSAGSHEIMIGFLMGKNVLSAKY